MKKPGIALALVALNLAGCSLAVRGELLNPLNKSGRVESTTSVPAPSPAVSSPAPTPTPQPSVSPTPVQLSSEAIAAIGAAVLRAFETPSKPTPTPTPEVK